MIELERFSEPERKLWAYVLLQAITDLKGRDFAARSARAWFASKDKSIGSLEWVCHHMALDPDAVRQSVLKNNAAKLRDSIGTGTQETNRAA
ncbi:MAG TPA: hypothetical protein VFU31_29930 [Candidatus Binatia bacterium]|nr:hypothetical protein [Candidatus Binatia bacterium]